MGDKLIYELNRRFENIEQNSLYSVSTFLDPRYKYKFFVNSDTFHQVKARISLAISEKKREQVPGTAFEKLPKKQKTSHHEHSNITLLRTMNEFLSSSDDEMIDTDDKDVDISAVIDKYVRGNESRTKKTLYNVGKPIQMNSKISPTSRRYMHLVHRLVSLANNSSAALAHSTMREEIDPMEKIPQKFCF